MRSSNVIAAGAALLAATVLAGEPLAASPREQLKARAAQAQDVLRQVNALDLQFGRTVEAWNGARYELDKTRAQLASDRAMLRVADHQQRIAVARVRERLVALYESSDDPTTIAVFFGSTNLSDMLGRLDAAQTISTADHNLAVETTAARVRYAAAERRARRIEQRRAAAVQQLDSQRQQIESMLAKRRQLLSSIQSQIASLKAQEARRQAILAAQARARLAVLRQQASARAASAREAATRAAAARAAAARRAALPDSPAQTTSPSSTGVTPAATKPPMPAPANLVGGHPEAATLAMQYLGVPYVWGGSTPTGFDCSGLVMYVFARLGISLPHYAAAQYGYGAAVSADQLQPGDLVFFDGLGHVGIYIGNGQMIHAPHTGDVVKISPLTDFGGGYVGARRV